MVEAVIGFRDAGNLKPPVAGAQSIEVPVLAPIIMRLGCPSDLYGTDGPIQRLLGKQHLPVLKSLADGMNATCRIDRRPGIGDHLIEAYKGKPLEEFFQNLRAEIEVAAIDAGKTSPDHLRLGAPAVSPSPHSGQEPLPLSCW